MMTATILVARRGSGVRVNADAELLHECVNSLRNAIIPISDRHPLTFEQMERRGTSRVPLHVPVQLTPLSVEDGDVRLIDERRTPFEGFTTDLSLRGMGFTHEQPITDRHVAVTFDLPEVPTVSLLVEICWSMPLECGGHHSGGRLLSLIELTEPDC